MSTHRASSEQAAPPPDPPVMHRPCTKCGTDLELTEENFLRQSFGHGFRRECRRCHNKQVSERAKARRAETGNVRPIGHGRVLTPDEAAPLVARFTAAHVALWDNVAGVGYGAAFHRYNASRALRELTEAVEALAAATEPVKEPAAS